MEWEELFQIKLDNIKKKKVLFLFHLKVCVCAHARAYIYWWGAWNQSSFLPLKA